MSNRKRCSLSCKQNLCPAKKKALSASDPLSPAKRRFLLLMRTPAVTETVEPRHRRMAMTTSSINMPSPPGEWVPPVVRRESTEQPPQHWSHLPHSHRGIITSAYTHPCCGRARSAPLPSIGDRCERPPSAQPTWRVVTAGGLTGNDRTAAPALVTSAPISPRNHRFCLYTPLLWQSL